MRNYRRVDGRAPRTLYVGLALLAVATLMLAAGNR
jgi:hypothetical protein